MDVPVSTYAAVRAPLTIRGVTFRNRTMLAAMGLDMAELDGRMSPALGDFYANVARGGVGAAMLSNTSVSPETALLPRALKLVSDDHASSMAPVIGEIERGGAVAGIQLQHYGAQGMTTLTRGRAVLSPSGVPCPVMQRADPRYRIRVMDLDDIARIRGEFADAAQRAVRAGARLLQLQASNGYLLSSFLSKGTNHRDDAYGGDPERRARFVAEVVADVRATIGDGVVLGLRLQLDDFVGPEGLEPRDVLPVVPMLEDAGVDMIEASFCIGRTFSQMSENTAGTRAKLAGRVRDLRAAARVPVGFSGFVGSLRESCALIEDGTVDYVAMARALLADNDLVAKELSGREDRVHRCLWDGQCFRDKYDPKRQRVMCCVNPRYARPGGPADLSLQAEAVHAEREDAL